MKVECCFRVRPYKPSSTFSTSDIIVLHGGESHRPLTAWDIYSRFSRTTADFLTSVSDPNARHFQPGREVAAPKTPAELEQAFRASDHYRRLLEDIEDFEVASKRVDCERHRRFEAAVKDGE